MPENLPYAYNFNVYKPRFFWHGDIIKFTLPKITQYHIFYHVIGALVIKITKGRLSYLHGFKFVSDGK